MEYDPWVDNRGYQSAPLVNRIMFQYLSRIAVKKKGIDPSYINPRITNPPNTSR